MAKPSKGKVAFGAVIGTALGAAAGFITGILTAPKSGKETRGELKEVAVETGKEIVADVKKVKTDVTGKAKAMQTKAMNTADEVVEEVTERAEDIKARVGQAVDGAQKGFKKNPASAKKNVAKK